MAVTSVVCPHCNARRGDVDTRAVAKQLSPEEIRAMVAVDAPAEAAHGGVAALVWPHPATRGVARAAEALLTVVTLPLVLAGVVTLAFARRRRARIAESRGELVPVVAMIGLGGLGLSTILSLFDVATGTNLLVTLGSIVALCIRGGIRGHAAAERSRDLQRLPPAARALRGARPLK